jgi:hypothetical protein
MKKVMLVLAALCFLSLPLTSFAGEGPMSLPAGSNAGAVKHNMEGIDHWGQGHYDVALKHFQAASKADSSIAQTHFNEAICLDKLGRQDDSEFADLERPPRTLTDFSALPTAGSRA